MEENEVMNTEVTVNNDEMMEIVPDQQSEKSTGLTTGQKATGIFVIVAAAYGVGSLIYKGVKWVIKKVKNLKAKKAAKKDVEITPDDDVIDVDMTAEEIQNASTEK